MAEEHIAEDGGSSETREARASEWSIQIQEQDDEEEEENLPLWVISLREKWYSTKQKLSHAWKRRGAVKQFLRAVKEVCYMSSHGIDGASKVILMCLAPIQGDTTEALCCLANNPFLLAYGTYAQDGDTVWHLLAEFGDTSLLLALINFTKIHPPKALLRRRRGGNDGQSECDDAILWLVNVGNDLKQTPLMFAAYHGRDDVIIFLLQQVRGRTHAHPHFELFKYFYVGILYNLQELSHNPASPPREPIHGPLIGVGSVQRCITPA